MPHSQYVAQREPPSILDRALAHPFVIPLGLSNVLVGALLLLSMHPRVVVSRALDDVHPLSLILLAGALFYGTFLLYRGALFHKCRWSIIDAMKAEMQGSLVSAASNFALVLSILLSQNPYAAITIVLILGPGWGHIFNVIALYVSRRRLKAKKVEKKRIKEQLGDSGGNA